MGIRVMSTTCVRLNNMQCQPTLRSCLRLGRPTIPRVLEWSPSAALIMLIMHTSTITSLQIQSLYHISKYVWHVNMQCAGGFFLYQRSIDARHRCKVCDNTFKTPYVPQWSSAAIPTDLFCMRFEPCVNSHELAISSYTSYLIMTT